jgi:hypothetical protein
MMSIYTAAIVEKRFAGIFEVVTAEEVISSTG